jgi:peptide/nickel transport system substrate-binding protein
MQDWKVSNGTGPFMLTDYVPASSVTMVGNPNYWKQHPLYPEDTLPYLDGIKILIIPDLSTRLAALRTGKVDWYRGVTWEDGESLMTTNPELNHIRKLATGTMNIFMRTDRPELPFYDVRVRQALGMAVDRQAIIDEYYGGNAVLLSHPITPVPEFGDMYIPLEELPESIQELYEYHPDKARQLLAEAGYPDGFVTSIITTSTSVDLLSVVKDYWSKVGVDLTIDVKEVGAFRNISNKRSHEEMITGSGVNSTPRSWNNFRPGSLLNASMIDDPRLNEAHALYQEYFFDFDKLVEVTRDVYPYILEQAWSVQMPAVYSYTMWQPWVKDYRGEYSLGCWNLYKWIENLWIDVDLKAELTGR